MIIFINKNLKNKFAFLKYFMEKKVEKIAKNHKIK
jgi:hypothetical protein